MERKKGLQFILLSQGLGDVHVVISFVSPNLLAVLHCHEPRQGRPYITISVDYIDFGSSKKVSCQEIRMEPLPVLQFDFAAQPFQPLVLQLHPWKQNGKVKHR